MPALVSVISISLIIAYFIFDLFILKKILILLSQFLLVYQIFLFGLHQQFMDWQKKIV